MRKLALPCVILAALTFAIWLSPRAPLSFRPSYLAAQTTCSTLPFTFANGTIADATQVNSDLVALRNCINNNLAILTAGLSHVTTNTALKALAGGSVSIVMRDGFSSVGDGGAAIYYFSAISCNLNGGAGDNGYQVAPGTGAGCWKLAPSYPLRREMWGVGSTVTFYVTKTGNDYSGANSCLLSGDPCLTLNQAAIEYYQFPWYGSAESVSIGVGTWLETVSISSPILAAPGVINATITPRFRLIGSGSSTIIAGDGSQCGTIIASFSGIVSVEQLTLTGVGAACQSILFAQEAGQIHVFDGVAFGDANQQHIHAEEFGAIEIWDNYTVSFGAGEHWGVATGGVIDYNPNPSVITLVGSPNFVEFGLIQHGGMVHMGNATSFSGGIGTGKEFIIESGGILVSDNSSTIPVPGTPGAVSSRGVVFPEAKLVQAVGVASATGLGAGGTAAVAVGSNSHTGRVLLSPSGAGIAGVGGFTLNLGFAPTDESFSTINCGALVSGYGTGSWAPGSLAITNTPSLTAPSINIAWNNGTGPTALTAAQTYSINYKCGD